MGETLFSTLSKENTLLMVQLYQNGNVNIRIKISSCANKRQGQPAQWTTFVIFMLDYLGFPAIKAENMEKSQSTKISGVLQRLDNQA